MIAVRGLSERRLRRSLSGCWIWSNSGPSSFFRWSWAPVANSLTLRTARPTQAAASGSRSGPRMKSPATTRTRISGMPMFSNTAPAYGY
ncbi:hypothetical protein WY02_21325 [Pseudonocardia sp. AL041005-10]|nr:hypothetical protein WY02_21325 [Pseudonocardia sp. AL041005-10]